MTVIMNLRQDSACMESLKNNFWSDFKSLFFSGESIPQTTFTVSTEDPSDFQVPLDEKRQVEVTLTPTETITITNLETGVSFIH